MSAAGEAPGLTVHSHPATAEMHARDSESDSEEPVMEEAQARGSAAEIPVTSNGEDMKHMMTGGPTLKETRIVSSSFGNPSEGIIEAETYRGSSFFPKSPVLFPSNAAASRLAEHAQDVSGPAGIHTSPWETYSFSQLAMH